MAPDRDPQRTPTIVPFLIYDDVAAAIEWLSRAFGFRERADMRMTASDGAVEHAEMDVDDDAHIILGTPSIHGASPKNGVSATIIVYVGDVDRHHERAEQAGARILIAPETMFWGDRRYQCADPEGHLWHFSQHVGTAGGQAGA